MHSIFTANHLQFSDHVEVMYTPVDSSFRKLIGVRSASQQLLNKLFRTSGFGILSIKRLFQEWKTDHTDSKRDFVVFLQTNLRKHKVRIILYNVTHLLDSPKKYVLTEKGHAVYTSIEKKSILGVFLKEFLPSEGVGEVEVMDSLTDKQNVFVIFTQDVIRLLCEMELIEDVRKKQVERNKQKLRFEKQKILVNNFMQGSASSLTQISLQGLRQSCKNRHLPYEGRTKTQLIQSLMEYRNHLSSMRSRQKQQQDIFGNTIVRPVLGNDGIIYDEKSVKQWFRKDAQGRYVNIAYVYNNKGDAVPNYVSMGGTQPLKSYKPLNQ